MENTDRMYEIMRDESMRLKTFQMNPPWPKDYIDVKKLAKAGFFYAFKGDCVHCAFCRGQVCKWDRGDDPMAEHARHFTTCPFIMGGDVGNEPLGDDPFPGPKRPRPYDVCGIYPYFQSDNLEQFNYNYGITYEQETETETETEPEPEQELNLPNHQPHPLHPVNQHHTPAYDDSSSDRQSRNSLSSETSNNSGNSAGNLNGICKICYTNSIELVFLPCGHSVSCLSCAHRLHSCPFCRTTITTRIRTFLV